VKVFVGPVVLALGDLLPKQALAHVSLYALALPSLGGAL
jgi:hypothetical protein